MYALGFDMFGGPEVLHYIELPTPPVPDNAIQLRMIYAGLNFADIYRRRGHYILEGTAPYISGYEGVGRITAVGRNVSGWHIGDRVGFADVPFAQAEYVNVPTEKAIALPHDIRDETAASLLLQGLTACYLVSDCADVKKGQTALVTAAAGGVGRLLIQLLKSHDIHVIALASTEEKRNVARTCGAEYALSYDDWETGKLPSVSGINYVFDSIGTTLPLSINTLNSRGKVILFGKSGGALPLIDVEELMMHSKSIVGGDLWSYLASPHERKIRVAYLFDAIRNHTITPPNIEIFSLQQGAEAHRRLEDRNFSGKILLKTVV